MFKGYRRRSWIRLNQYEKGLYKCALEITKETGRAIVNVTFIAKLISIILKLITPISLKLRIFGLSERNRLLKLYKERCIFRWIPRLENWIMESDYIAQLGLKVLQKKSAMKDYCYES